MSIYLRKEFRGRAGPYFRLEEKRWDRKTGRVKTRQIEYFGKIENVPPEIFKKYSNLTGQEAPGKENSMSPDKYPPPTTAKTLEANSQGEKEAEDKKFVHYQILKYYGPDYHPWDTWNHKEPENGRCAD